MRKLAFIVAIQLIVTGMVLNLSTINRVGAQINPEIFIEPSTYVATSIGEVFNVSVNIRNVTADQRIVTAQFRVQYNESLLEAINATEGPFMKQFNNTAGKPTFFIVFIEDDPMYGPNVLVGILIIPNATGSWTNFPEGEGVLATITFKAKSQLWQPLSCNLILNDTLLVNPDVDYIPDPDEVVPHTVTHGYYEMQPKSPIITHSPSKPSAGEVIIFESPNYTYTGYNILYCWNFGDGSATNTTEPSTHHVYALPGDYNVTLKCIADGIQSDATSVIVPVGFYMPLEAKIDVGSPHFRGEIVDFGVLITHLGKTVNATKIEAILYYNGSIYVDLSASVQYVDTGFYRIPYNIAGDAETGTYTLVVKAEYYAVNGTNLKSFVISSTLTGFIRDITQEIATIKNDLTEVKLNLTAINATLVDIDGKLTTIQTSLGLINANLTVINAKLIILEGTVAVINSSLGTLTTGLTNINLKVINITENIATIQTSLGTIQGEITTIKNDTATIETRLGTVETDISEIKGTTSDITGNLGTLMILIYVAVILSLIAAIGAILSVVQAWKK